MIRRILTGLLVAAMLAACAPAAAPSPTVTLIVIPPPATQTPTVDPQLTADLEPPLTTLTSAPTATPLPFATPTPRAASSLAPGTVDRVYIYLIAVGDEGRSGELIGCGDSAVAVERTVAPTESPLRVALEELFSIKEERVGESELYNALHMSDFTISRVVIENGVAKIDLTGTMSLGGICDNPRVEAQIEFTALQFSTVTSVQVTVNGTPLEDLLSMEGG